MQLHSDNPRLSDNFSIASTICSLVWRCVQLESQHDAGGSLSHGQSMPGSWDISQVLAEVTNEWNKYALVIYIFDPYQYGYGYGNQHVKVRSINKGKWLKRHVSCSTANSKQTWNFPGIITSLSSLYQGIITYKGLFPSYHRFIIIISPEAWSGPDAEPTSSPICSPAFWKDPPVCNG